jgi:chromate transporter
LKTPVGHVHGPTCFCRSASWRCKGFGGVLAIVQRELVEKRRWMTREQFVEEWAVAQVMPGPNVVNLSLMIGGRYFGLSGALAALAGMLAAPLVVVLLLAFFYGKVADTAWAQNALRGMGMVSAGLIAATGIKLMSALRSNVMGWRICALLAASYIRRHCLAALAPGLGAVGAGRGRFCLGLQVYGEHVI